MILKEKITVDIGKQKIPLVVVKNVNQLLNEVDNEENIPFWAELWPSAIALARHFWQHGEINGRGVLELGSGLGLPGIVAAIKGARVTQTDFVQEALDLARENATLNQVTTRLLREDWRAFGLNEKFDVILGSDILYEPKLHKYIGKILKENIKEGGHIFLADPGRKDAIDYIAKLQDEGWDVNKYHYEIRQRELNYKVTIYLLKAGNS